MTSSLEGEVPTNTSEDFGFKSLGQKNILPSSNETLPFSSLDHFNISNDKQIYIAYSGNKLVTGDLQKLRDFIVSKEESVDVKLQFTFEKDIEDIIFCGFDINSQAIVVTRAGIIFSIGTSSSNELHEITAINKTISHIKLFHNLLWILDDQQSLFNFDFANNKLSDTVRDNVASFDLFQDYLYVLLNTGTDNIQIFKGERSPQLIKSFSNPQELEASLQENKFVPLNISTISTDQFLIVYGNCISSDDEDVTYEQKMYITKFNQIEESLTFHESFDIAPSYGAVLRYPYIYNIILDKLIDECNYVSIIGSSCASELTIYDSNEVIQPSQDSERAVLPINQNTDNDTNPTGLSLDISTSGKISNVCLGVDSIDSLPLIYILNNEGDLQIVGLFHSSAIKNGKFHVDNLKAFLHENNKIVTPLTSSENIDDGKVDIAEPVISPPIENFTTSGQQKSAFGQTFESKLPNPFTFSTNSTNSTSSKSTPFLTNQNTFGQSTFNSSETPGAAFGKPTFGSTSFQNITNKSSEIQSPFSNFGNKATTSFSKSSAFGAPAFGSANFGSLSKNKDDRPLFGNLVKNDGDNTKQTTAFGTPSFGSLPLDNNLTTKANEAQSKPLFGNFKNDDQHTNLPSSAFGKPSFGTPSYGTNTSKLDDDKVNTNVAPIFGTTTFGRNLKTDNTANSPFGTATFGNTSFGKSAFDASTFDKTTFSSNAFSGKSFGSLHKTEELYNEPTREDNTSVFGKGPVFGKQMNQVSPFVHLKGAQTEDKQMPAFDFDVEQDGDAEHEHEGNDSSISTSHTTEEGDSSIDNLDDSTVEQTPFDLDSLNIGEESSKQNEDDKVNFEESVIDQQEFEKKQDEEVEEVVPVDENKTKLTIASLADRIKKSANISTEVLTAQSFGSEITNEKSSTNSPFSSFANEIDAPTKVFSFSMEDNPAVSLNKSYETGDKGEDSVREEKPENKLSSEPEVKSTAFDSLQTNVDTQEQLSDENTEISKERSNSDNSHIKDNDRGTSSSKVEESDLEVIEKTESIDKHINDESQSVADECVSRTEEEQEGNIESFDELDDLTEEELKNASEPFVEKVMISGGIQSSPETTSIETQTIVPQANHQSTQGPAFPPCDIDVQTEPYKTCNFEIQAFEDSESYLAEIHKPIPLPEYYTNAVVESYPSLYDTNVMRSIEKTYKLVEAEFIVLEENVKNLDEFFKDQCTLKLSKRTVESLPNIYTWRLTEANRLHEIASKLKKEYLSNDTSFLELSEKISEFTVDVLKSITQMSEIKESILQVKYLAESTLDNKYKDLGLHQSKMQNKLRQKMNKVFNELNRIEELMNILKIYITKDNDIDKNPLINKLTVENGHYNNLLENIKELQEGIKELKVASISDKETGIFEDQGGYSLAKEEITSIEVVELGMKLNTKRQLGNFFKNMNK